MSRRVLLEAYLCVSALLLVGFLLSLAWRPGDARELILDVLRAELVVSIVFGVIAFSAGLLMLRDAIVARWKGESQPPRGRH